MIPLTWNESGPMGHESAKIASIAVPYLQGGRFLDLGCGDSPVWPSAIGVDNYSTYANTFGIKHDIADLSMFADKSMDAVFSSHAVEDFEPSKVPALLREWARVIKFGGFMCLYVPSANLYPRVGEQGANPAHKGDIYPGDLEKILWDIVTDHGWELVESEERSGTNEYSLWIVVKKIKEIEWRENIWQRNPNGQKRCLVIRYGAIGDAIQTSSIFRPLQAQGYHLTVNCKPESYEILKHDPYVDDWILQANDFVPNHQLGPYWESLAERYDRVINLCESVEGSLLTLPGRLTHQYPDDVRRTLFGNVSYLARTHDIAGVVHDYAPQFYMSPYEQKWANALIRAWTGLEVPVVLWAIAGSSTHKIYPWVAVVMKWLLEKTPCHIVLTGDKDVGSTLQAALIAEEHYEGFDLGRVHPMAGKWTIRETLSVAQNVNVVVGPETGVLNSVSFNPDVAKVLYLSHSSRRNIGSEWLNTTVIEPDTKLSPCYPCHRLHSDWQYCFRSEKTHAALCASAIPPEAIFHAIMTSLGATRQA